MNKKTSFVIILVFLGGGFGISYWGFGALSPGRSAESVGPMLQQVGQDRAMLVWRRPEWSSVKVTLRKKGGAERVSYTPEQRGGWLSVVFEPLLPDTAYAYEVTSATEAAEAGAIDQGHFRTDPGPGKSFRFLCFGDSGTGRSGQRNLAKRMAAYPAALIVHTGDIVYPQGEVSDYPAKFFQPYAELLKTTPAYPCLGNHDWDYNQGEGYYQSFVLPENGPAGLHPERNYWFDYGGVRFIAFDSDHAFSEMRDGVVPWLDRVLADAGDRWKVVYFHHPVYTNGIYTPSGKLLEMVVPLFDRYGVELVLNGHSHMYERSKPIRGGKVVEAGEGTVYVVSGGGGGKLHDIIGPMPETLVMQVNDRYSFTVVDVTEREMTLRQIDEDGKEIDRFHVKRREVDLR